MKRSHGFFMIASLLAVGLLVATYRSVHAPAESIPASAKQPVGPAALPEAAELAELRREMVRLTLMVRSQRQPLPAEGPAATVENGVAGAKDPREATETRAEAKHRRREYMAGIAAAFRDETMDPRWSSATLAVVQTAISGDDDLKPLARAVECRSHTCRMEIADDGTGKLGQIIPQFAERLGQSLPSIVASHVEEPGGGAITVLYMSRPETAMTP